MKRTLLVLSALVALGCSNACPAPVLCSEPHLDYCPCLVVDGGPRPDAFVEPVDAFVEPADTGSADDAGSDAGFDAASTSDAGSDANVDAM